MNTTRLRDNDRIGCRNQKLLHHLISSTHELDPIHRATGTTRSSGELASIATIPSSATIHYPPQAAFYFPGSLFTNDDEDENDDGRETPPHLRLPMIPWTASMRGYTFTCWIQLSHSRAAQMAGLTSVDLDAHVFRLMHQDRIVLACSLSQFLSKTCVIDLQSLQDQDHHRRHDVSSTSRTLWSSVFGGSGGGSSTTTTKGKSTYRSVRQHIPIQLDQWHHLVLAHAAHYVGQDSVEVYVDGHLVLNDQELAFPDSGEYYTCEVGGGTTQSWMSEIVMYDGRLTRETIERLYSVGPNNPSNVLRSSFVPRGGGGGGSSFGSLLPRVVHPQDHQIEHHDNRPSSSSKFKKNHLRQDQLELFTESRSSSALLDLHSKIIFAYDALDEGLERRPRGDIFICQSDFMMAFMPVVRHHHFTSGSSSSSSGHHHPSLAQDRRIVFQGHSSIVRSLSTGASSSCLYRYRGILVLVYLLDECYRYSSIAGNNDDDPPTTTTTMNEEQLMTLKTCLQWIHSFMHMDVAGTLDGLEHFIFHSLAWVLIQHKVKLSRDEMTHLIQFVESFRSSKSKNALDENENETEVYLLARQSLLFLNVSFWFEQTRVVQRQFLIYHLKSRLTTRYAHDHAHCNVLDVFSMSCRREWARQTHYDVDCDDLFYQLITTHVQKVKVIETQVQALVGLVLMHCDACCGDSSSLENSSHSFGKLCNFVQHVFGQQPSPFSVDDSLNVLGQYDEDQMIERWSLALSQQLSCIESLICVILVPLDRKGKDKRINAPLLSFVMQVLYWIEEHDNACPLISTEKQLLVWKTSIYAHVLSSRALGERENIVLISAFVSRWLSSRASLSFHFPFILACIPHVSSSPLEQQQLFMELVLKLKTSVDQTRVTICQTSPWVHQLLSLLARSFHTSTSVSSSSSSSSHNNTCQDLVWECLLVLFLSSMSLEHGWKFWLQLLVEWKEAFVSDIIEDTSSRSMWCSSWSTLSRLTQHVLHKLAHERPILTRALSHNLAQVLHLVHECCVQHKDTLLDDHRGQKLLEAVMDMTDFLLDSTNSSHREGLRFALSSLQHCVGLLLCSRNSTTVQDIPEHVRHFFIQRALGLLERAFTQEINTGSVMHIYPNTRNALLNLLRWSHEIYVLMECPVIIQRSLEHLVTTLVRTGCLDYELGTSRLSLLSTVADIFDHLQPSFTSMIDSTTRGGSLIAREDPMPNAELFPQYQLIRKDHHHSSILVFVPKDDHHHHHLSTNVPTRVVEFFQFHTFHLNLRGLVKKMQWQRTKMCDQEHLRLDALEHEQNQFQASVRAYWTTQHARFESELRPRVVAHGSSSSSSSQKLDIHHERPFPGRERQRLIPVHHHHHHHRALAKIKTSKNQHHVFLSHKQQPVFAHPKYVGPHRSYYATIIINSSEAEWKISAVSCRQILPQGQVPGVIYVSHTKIVFLPQALLGSVTEEHTLDTAPDDEDTSRVHHVVQEWPLVSLEALLLRCYRLRDSAFELFLENGKVIFLDIFDSSVRRASVVACIASSPLVCSSRMAIQHLMPSDDQSLVHALVQQHLQLWQQRKISNFEYLMALNTFSGRSFNDLSQYPVFPWILKDYSSRVLDLEDAASYRDLSKPMGALCHERAARFQERYDAVTSGGELPPFHYGSHYSTPTGVVLHYLCRLEPFTRLHQRVQSSSTSRGSEEAGEEKAQRSLAFDTPDRLFRSIETSWKLNSGGDSDQVSELIPEFFTLPDFLRNDARLELGTTQDGTKVDEVMLPPWANASPETFIQVHHQALESDFVSSQLHLWIDLIFGYKQRGPDAKTHLNVFYYLTYYGLVDWTAINHDEALRMATEAQIAHFGQCPMQLFDQAHPARGNNNEGGLDLVKPKNKASSTETTASTQEEEEEEKPPPPPKPLMHHMHPPSVSSAIRAISILPSNQVISINELGMIITQDLDRERIQPQNLAFYQAFVHEPSSSSSHEQPLIMWDNLVIAAGDQRGDVHFVLLDNDDDASSSSSSSGSVGDCQVVAQVQVYGHLGQITCLDVDRDSGLCVSGSTDLTLNVWHIRHLSSVSSVPRSQSPPSSSSSSSSSQPQPQPQPSHQDIQLYVSSFPIQKCVGHSSSILDCVVRKHLDLVASCSNFELIVHALTSGHVLWVVPANNALGSLSCPSWQSVCVSDTGMIVSHQSSSSSLNEAGIITVFSINGRYLHTETLTDLDDADDQQLIHMSLLENVLVLGYQHGRVQLYGLEGSGVLDLLECIDLSCSIPCTTLTFHQGLLVIGHADGSLTTVRDFRSSFTNTNYDKKSDDAHAPSKSNNTLSSRIEEFRQLAFSTYDQAKVVTTTAGTIAEEAMGQAKKKILPQFSHLFRSPK